MQMEKEFDVDRPRAEAAQLLADEAVLCDLFPDSTTEIVARKGQRKAVTLTERKQKTRVRIELEGRTKALIPEFTIRGPMQDQLDQMAKALRKRLGAKASV
ncbi:MAG: hypothetical protein NTZ61_18235 [Proteobacteria bacterium]|nr:hypothetical protein [Pseudomonadota bacterium]